MLRLFSFFLAAVLSFNVHAEGAAEAKPPQSFNWDLGSRPGLAIQLPGMSHHFQEPEATGREWNETHAGFGLEWRSNWSEGWTFKRSIGIMRDSVHTWGAHGGVVWQKRLLESQNWQLDAGGGAFLFYRALHFDGKRQWLPAVLPVVSIEHKSSGYGMNLVFVPHFRTGSGEMPAVLYAQFTKTF